MDGGHFLTLMVVYKVVIVVEELQLQVMVESEVATIVIQSGSTIRINRVVTLSI